MENTIIETLPADRVVTLGAHGQWEVRAPHAVLAAGSRSAAVQWAWNITRDTGGRVLLPRHARTGRDEDPQ